MHHNFKKHNIFVQIFVDTKFIFSELYLTREYYNMCKKILHSLYKNLYHNRGWIE